MLGRVTINPLIGMRPEEIALRLQDVGRALGAAVTIVKRQCRGQCRGGDTAADRADHGLAPTGFGGLYFGDEKWVLQQAGWHRAAGKTGFYVTEKAAANDAAGTPEQRNIAAPALASALAFYDGYRCANGSANILQAQRDFFGAHSYQRVDRDPAEHFHTRWLGDGGEEKLP